MACWYVVCLGLRDEGFIKSLRVMRCRSLRGNLPRPLFGVTALRVCCQEVWHVLNCCMPKSSKY